MTTPNPELVDVLTSALSDEAEAWLRHPAAEPLDALVRRSAIRAAVIVGDRAETVLDGYYAQDPR
jgi:hypothetical protein